MIRRLRPPWWAIAAGIALSLGLPAFLPVGDWRAMVPGLPVIAMGFAIVILGAVERAPRPGAVTAPLAAIGRWSYGIYLFHLPVSRWGIDLVRERGWRLGFELEFLLYVLASMVVGLVATQIVERPLLRLRDRVVP